MGLAISPKARYKIICIDDCVSLHCLVSWLIEVKLARLAVYLGFVDAIAVK